jgi:DNA-binding response OmpR family regulator
MARVSTRVFVVEDEIIVSMELEHMLSQLGCHVLGTAGSLHDAIEKARRLEFDLAIVDLKLGRQSGEPVVEAVARRQIPLIITSGDELGEADKLGIHMLLPKPFTLEELRLAVSFALSERHGQERATSSLPAR